MMEVEPHGADVWGHNNMPVIVVQSANNISTKELLQTLIYEIEAKQVASGYVP